jgi:glycosyltransferase involved in cell wall biosynthesis
MKSTFVSERSDPELSVVVPLFNESEGVGIFAEELRSALGALNVSYEVIFVDDGSVDGTAMVAARLNWTELKILVLSMNVGHQNAIEAGLSVAQGKWIVTMDGDGQHPPTLISTLYRTAEETGVDVVYTSRLSRDADSLSKRSTALLYYRVMRWLTEVPIRNSQADFRLISRHVLNQIRAIPGDKVLRLLLPSIGFRSALVEYETAPRIAGKGRFGRRRQIRLTIDSVLGFSSKPLKLIASLGVIVTAVAAAWLVSVLFSFLAGENVEGWTSVMSAVLAVGGVTLLSLSIVGSYIARIHDLLKGYPRYSIQGMITGTEE